MTPTPPSDPPSTPHAGASVEDPGARGPSADSHDELAQLPAPRRPWRRATLVTLTLSALGSLVLAVLVMPDVGYSLKSGPPRDLGDLTSSTPAPDTKNDWVHGEASLSTTRAIRYRRPLESDSYRLAQVEGNPRVWVQIRVPAGEEGPRFVPPTSFVGRIVPVADSGLRQQDLRAAVSEVGLAPPSEDAWLLIDGESPAAMRWVLGLLLLLTAFFVFNVVGLVQLGRNIPAEREPQA